MGPDSPEAQPCLIFPSGQEMTLIYILCPSMQERIFSLTLHRILSAPGEGVPKEGIIISTYRVSRIYGLTTSVTAQILLYSPRAVNCGSSGTRNRELA